MKADRTRDFEHEPERASLRDALRSWAAPPTPDELEAALRSDFLRRRREPARVARPGLPLWLSLAAGLAFLVAWPLVAHRREERPAPASVAVTGRVPLAATPAPTRPRVEPPAPTAVRAPAQVSVRRGTTRRRTTQPAVVVEPGQAELLAEFGRAEWARTQAGPGVSVQAMPESRTPAFRAEWEGVGGEWPAVQVAVSKSGR
jgi:hypothetical protein